MPTVDYRCTNCLDHTLTRNYDVSHIAIKCPSCGEFGRFVHSGVFDQYEAFEADPPESLEWDHLGTLEKFVVAEGIVRQGKSVEDYGTRSDPDDGSADGSGDT